MGVVVRRTMIAPSGGFQMGGSGSAPAPAEPRRAESRLRPAQRPVRSFGTRTESYDDALQTLRRLQEPVAELMRQARLGNAVDTGVVTSVVSDVADSMQTHPSAIITLARIKQKNQRAYMHAVAVCALMINLGRQLGLDLGTQRDLGVAGLLHDIGETTLPAGLLEREVKFGKDELAIVRLHPARGHEQLQRVTGLPAVALDVCLHHHERVDGAGYPSSHGEIALSLEARMAAICDVYDAITSYRPYNEIWSPPAGLSEMFASTGQFDPTLLAHFIRSVGIYPAGSLVRLESEHLALVLDQAGEDLTRPIVRAFYSIPDRTRIAFHDIDLANDNSDAIASREEPRKWGFYDWDSQWPRLIRQP